MVDFVLWIRVPSGMCLGYLVSRILQLPPAAALVAGRNKKVLSGHYTLSGLFGTSAG